MGQLQREVARLFAVQSQKLAAAAQQQPHGGRPGKQLLHYVPSPPTKSRARRALANLLLPVWFKYFRGPLDRWNLAVMAKYLRDHGLMYDDLYSDKEPVIARALEMLPPDIAAARYRRLMRGAHLNHLRLYLPLHEQNYDPFIPYMAPYVEEAKFQLQEEEELLGYHMWEGTWYSGGVTGFGDKDPGEHFLLAFPNLYGAGGNAVQMAKRHCSSAAAASATSPRNGIARAHAPQQQQQQNRAPSLQ